MRRLGLVTFCSMLPCPMPHASVAPVAPVAPVALVVPRLSVSAVLMWARAGGLARW
ncbi:hypothetical protein VD0002_g2020 [Verticillium dahliae]|uniref:Uncharacterized protein n=1 Tax=Verticillium dahliae TaxID=27337 RepID=A0AA44WRP9_VERDA|nr:hypothetical protein BJF96_g2064 [Verticillium dahliae]PNH53809.1 hypothetical protein VD0003_g3660 [Verticillium dahliae]PNH67805.1 hypothetical protein VD0002_g2020 [Verticillium dahliae]